MSQLGMGAMLDILGGRLLEGITESIGKEIASMVLDKNTKEDGAVILTFLGGSKLTLYDNARSCCESRWLHTDDNLEDFNGAKLTEIHLQDGGSVGDDDVEESMFLRIGTDKGTAVIVAYNSHNGYYGGISINTQYKEAPFEPSTSLTDEED